MTTETLHYLVTADYAQLQALQGQIEKTNTAAAHSAVTSAQQEAAFNRAAGRAKYLALGIAGLGLVAFKSAADFQSAMNVFQVTARATGDQLAEARQKAVDLGNDIRLPGISARDAADAMNELAKGGLNAEAAMDAARSTLVLGKAANYDLAESATVVVRSLGAFGLEAKDSTMIVDTLAAAALKSTVGIQEIADGMQYAAQPAHVLGVGFQDTAAALALLNDAGIVGSQAGAALGVALTRLASPTKQASEAMRDLGLMTKEGKNLFFDAKGDFIGLANANKLLSGALEGTTQQQRLASLQAIFGIRGLRAANVVLGSGQKAWRDYAGAVREQGLSQKTLNAQARGGRGAIEALKSSAETAAISFGTVLAPALTQIFTVLSQVLNFLGRFPGITATVVGVIGGLAAALWAANAAMRALETAKLVAQYFKLAAVASKIWAAAQWLLNAALSANPILLVVVAVAALVAAFVLAYRHSETFRNAVNAVGQTLLNVARSVARFATQIFQAVVGGLTRVIGWVKSNWPLIAAALAGPLALAVVLVVRHFAQIRGAIVGALNAVVGFVRGAGRRIVTGLVNAIRGGIGAVRGAINAIKSAIISAFAGAASWLVGAGRDLVMGLVNGITSFAGRAIGAVQDMADKVMSIGGKVLGILHSPSVITYKWGQDVVQGLVNGTKNATPRAVRAMTNMAVTAMRAARATLKTQADTLGQYLGHAFQAAQQAATTPAERALRELGRGGMTPTEQLLKNMQEARDDAERQQRLSDAQRAMDQARSMEEFTSAQKQYEDAQYAITVAGLEKQADAEKAARDAQIAQLEAQAEAERKELEGRQFVQQLAFDKAMASLNTYLASSKATAAGARERITKLMTDFGIDMGAVGELLGSSFAEGMKKQETAVEAAAKTLARAVVRAIKQGLKIRSPSAVMRDQVGREVVRGVAAGITGNAHLVDRALTRVVPSPTMRPLVSAPAAATVGGPAVQINEMNVATELDAQRLSATLSNAVAVRR